MTQLTIIMCEVFGTDQRALSRVCTKDQERPCLYYQGLWDPWMSHLVTATFKILFGKFILSSHFVKSKSLSLWDSLVRLGIFH